MATPVFVRGFDFGTSEQQIRGHCAKTGKVISIEMQGQGAAIVTYAKAQSAMAAVENLNGTTILGNQRFIDVKIDEKGGSKGSSKGMGAATSLAGVKRPRATGGRCKVYVRGFDFDTSEEQLGDHLAQVGNILDLKFQSKGSAIATYSSPAEARAAVQQLNESIIDGNSRYIDVKIDEEDSGPIAKMPRYTAPAPVQTIVKYVVNGGGKSKKAKGSGGKKGGGKGKSDPPGSGRVFVRGFDFDTTDEVFEAHMSQAGDIANIFWVTKGSAVVIYATKAGARTAAQTLNATTMEGNSRYIDVMLKESE